MFHSKGSRRIVTGFLLFLLLLALAGIAAADTITIPPEVTHIDSETFFGDASIHQVILPEGLLSIGERAFDRTNITSIRLPSSLQSIADNCFDNTELQTIEARYGTYAYQWAYSYVASHPEVSLIAPEEAAAAGDTIKAFQYERQTIDVLVIGDHIKTIKKNAFASARIRKLFIPATVEVIEPGAFYGCQVERLDLVDGSHAADSSVIREELTSATRYYLTELDDGTFGIGYWVVPDDATAVTVPGAAINGTRISKIVADGRTNGITKLTVEEGIEEILSNLIIGDTIKELHLPQSLRIIGDWCFTNLGESYDDEFRYELPDGILSIGTGSFTWSGMLDSNAIYCFRKNSDTDKAFRNTTTTARISYYQHPDWVMRYTMYWQGSTPIDERIIHVIDYRGSSSHVYLPNVGKAVDQNSVYQNDAVESVYVPEGYIQAGSFSYCSNLREIVLPSTLETSVDPWYIHDEYSIYVQAGCSVISKLEADNRGKVFTYSFHPGLSLSAELTPEDISLALTYTNCDLFSVSPWPIGPELSQQEETAIILSFLEAVCESDSGKRITLTSLRMPDLCGEEIRTHYFDASGRNVPLRYTIDTMLIATGKIKGSLSGLTAGASSVVGTAWITVDGLQYVIMPSSPESIVRSLNAMQTILHIDAAAALKEALTLNVDAFDVFGKNGFIAYLEKIFTEAGIDTTSLETIDQVEETIQSKSDEEFYENLKKLIEMAKKLS